MHVVSFPYRGLSSPLHLNKLSLSKANERQGKGRERKNGRFLFNEACCCGGKFSSLRLKLLLPAASFNFLTSLKNLVSKILLSTILLLLQTYSIIIQEFIASDRYFLGSDSFAKCFQSWVWILLVCQTSGEKYG